MRPGGDFNPEVFDYYPPLNKVRQYFESNTINPISLSTAARLAGYETKYFSAYFRNKVGIGFKEWVTRSRVRIAMESVQRHDRP
jgi:YesN/AraC family two-component response regulator